MSEINNLDAVIDYLSEEEVRHCHEEFDWGLPKDMDNMLGIDIAKRILDKTGIERHYLFFDNVHEYYKSLDTEDKKRDLCLWIIKKWGGISNVNPDIYETANKNILSLGSDENVEFERIASWSKYLTITNPKKYAIYDTRIAYCLNALIIVYDLNHKYFPMPANGRNKIVNSIMMDTIINILGLLENERRVKEQVDLEGEYYPKGEAYAEYLRLLGIIRNKLYGGNDDSELYKIESILFSISTELIPDLLIEKLKSKYVRVD